MHFLNYCVLFAVLALAGPTNPSYAASTSFSLGTLPATTTTTLSLLIGWQQTWIGECQAPPGESGSESSGESSSESSGEESSGENGESESDSSSESEGEAASTPDMTTTTTMTPIPPIPTTTNAHSTNSGMTTTDNNSGSSNNGSGSSSSSSSSDTGGITTMELVIIISVGVVICLILAITGIFFLQKYKHAKNKNEFGFARKSLEAAKAKSTSPRSPVSTGTAVPAGGATNSNQLGTSDKPYLNTVNSHSVGHHNGELAHSDDNNNNNNNNEDKIRSNSYVNKKIQSMADVGNIQRPHMDSLDPNVNDNDNNNDNDDDVVVINGLRKVSSDGERRWDTAPLSANTFATAEYEGLPTLPMGTPPQNNNNNYINIEMNNVNNNNFSNFNNNNNNNNIFYGNNYQMQQPSAQMAYQNQNNVHQMPMQLPPQPHVQSPMGQGQGMGMGMGMGINGYQPMMNVAQNNNMNNMNNGMGMVPPPPPPETDNGSNGTPIGPAIGAAIPPNNFHD